jgi:hypothetical protein
MPEHARFRWSLLDVTVLESGTRNQPMTKKPYVPPRVVVLGTVRDVVLGTAQNDTADMNTARYW